MNISYPSRNLCKSLAYCVVNASDNRDVRLLPLCFGFYSFFGSPFLDDDKRADLNVEPKGFRAAAASLIR